MQPWRPWGRAAVLPMGHREAREGLVAGRRAVRELLRSGRPVHRVYVAETAEGVEELLAEARRLGVPVQRVPRRWLDRQCGGLAHQGVAASAAAVAYADFDELVDSLARRPGPVRVLVLDHIQDPQNLGSLLRSAEASGVAGVVVASRRAAGLTPAVWRASAGAAAHVPVARASSIAAALEALKQADLWVVGAHPEGGQLLWEADLRGRVGLVIGAEGRGLSALVRQRCDVLVRIPLLGRLQSLNASVAGALLMYEALRQSLDRPPGALDGQEGSAGSVRPASPAGPG